MKKTIFSAENTKLVEWLKAQREAAGLSMRDLGKILGSSHSLVERVELQERRLDVCEYIIYCEALNIDPIEGIKLIQSIKKK
ncbi:helix-turn-helix domain-containing protein [Colwellia sp. MEBiC06753]